MMALAAWWLWQRSAIFWVVIGGALAEPALVA
jgi:hypothetical protein